MRRSPLLLSMGISASLALGALAAQPARATDAATVSSAVSSPLSASPGRMWQTDKTVSALAYAKGVLFVGGNFTKVRPPGTSSGNVAEVAQPYLAAFRTSDLSLITDFHPVLAGPAPNVGSVQALDVSPDGTRLYVGGDFTTIDGVSRSKVAAFDLTNLDPAASPATLPVLLTPTQFKASVSSRVYALAATNNTLYVGGTFTTAGGAARTRVAAFGAANGALLPWNVNLSGAYSDANITYSPMVTSLQVGAGDVYIGGMFNNVNGVAQHGLAVVDPVAGVSDPAFIVPSILPTSYPTAMALDGNNLYIAGRDSHTGDMRRLEGTMALTADTGSIRWGSDLHRCLGDTFALTTFAGAVWAGTHAHDCSAPGVNGHPENSFPDRVSHRFYASTIGHNAATGEMFHFFPDTAGSPLVPGSLDNVRAFATDGTRLFVGGGWQTVNGISQQNLNFYSLRTAVTSDPPVKVSPKATTDSTGAVTVSWISSTDRDDRNLTYRVFRRPATTPFVTVTAPSAFWSRQTMTALDNPAQGSTASYIVEVSDGDTRVASAASASITVAGPASRYDQAVKSDGPGLYWRLDDVPGSTTAADSSGKGITGVAGGTVAFGTTGALSTTPNGAATFAGASGLGSSVALPVASSYSFETWFRTTSSTGGKLVGFGDRQSGLSSSYDRHLYMTAAGQLTFGTYPGSVSVVTSPASYNNGSWHHAVVSQDAAGMRLYVDASLVASNSNPNAQVFAGYVRVGGDNLGGWPGQPADYFTGDLDEVAYYPVALRDDQILKHYSLR